MLARRGSVDLPQGTLTRLQGLMKPTVKQLACERRSRTKAGLAAAKKFVEENKTWENARLVYTIRTVAYRKEFLDDSIKKFGHVTKKAYERAHEFDNDPYVRAFEDYLDVENP